MIKYRFIVHTPPATTGIHTRVGDEQTPSSRSGREQFEGVSDGQQRWEEGVPSRAKLSRLPAKSYGKKNCSIYSYYFCGCQAFTPSVFHACHRLFCKIFNHNSLAHQGDTRNSFFLSVSKLPAPLLFKCIQGQANGGVDIPLSQLNAFYGSCKLRSDYVRYRYNRWRCRQKAKVCQKPNRKEDTWQTYNTGMSKNIDACGLEHAEGWCYVPRHHIHFKVKHHQDAKHSKSQRYWTKIVTLSKIRPNKYRKRQGCQ